jgi:hypothetical protein
VIEADKMIQVGMGDKDMGDPKDLSGGQDMDFSEVEEDGPSLKFYIDI